MILLLGGSGYIGQAFIRELHRRSLEFKSLARSDVDYSDFNKLSALLRWMRPHLVINCGGYAGKPNVDVCETRRWETYDGNVRLPITVNLACSYAGIPVGQVASGCIYNGAGDSGLLGFSESDEPNFCFSHPPCSYYSGTKELAERALAAIPGDRYLWRLRLPFDEYDHPRNYLTKLLRYPKAYENLNSLSHRGDFVKACLDLWETRAPFGTYNMTNPGWVKTSWVVEKIKAVLKPEKTFEFFANDDEFYATAAKAPRSNCLLNVSKLLEAGIEMRPVEDAVCDSLRLWVKEPAPTITVV